MSAQVTGRKRIPNREKLTAEDDALNQIAREAEARLAAKRAARAEAREIRMKELERQQKEISDDEERMSVGSRGSLRGVHSSDLHSSSSSLPSLRHHTSAQNGRVEERPDREFLDKGPRTASTLSAATLASLGGASSRRGSCDTSFSVETEASIREIKDSLVESEEKYRKAMVSNAQLHNEKSNLMYQVDTLKEALSELEEQLWEACRERDDRKKDFERERHAHTVLQFQFEQMRETLKQSEELLTKHGIAVSAEVKANGDVGPGQAEEDVRAESATRSAQESPHGGRESMLGNAPERLNCMGQPAESSKLPQEAVTCNPQRYKRSQDAASISKQTQTDSINQMKGSARRDKMEKYTIRKDSIRKRRNTGSTKIKGYKKYQYPHANSLLGNKEQPIKNDDCEQRVFRGEIEPEKTSEEEEAHATTQQDVKLRKSRLVTPRPAKDLILQNKVALSSLAAGKRNLQSNEMSAGGDVAAVAPSQRSLDKQQMENPFTIKADKESMCAEREVASVATASFPIEQINNQLTATPVSHNTLHHESSLTICCGSGGESVEGEHTDREGLRGFRAVNEHNLDNEERTQLLKEKDSFSNESTSVPSDMMKDWTGLEITIQSLVKRFMEKHNSMTDVPGMFPQNPDSVFQWTSVVEEIQDKRNQAEKVSDELQGKDVKDDQGDTVEDALEGSGMKTKLSTKDDVTLKDQPLQKSLKDTNLESSPTGHSPKAEDCSAAAVAEAKMFHQPTLRESPQSNEASVSSYGFTRQKVPDRQATVTNDSAKSSAGFVTRSVDGAMDGRGVVEDKLGNPVVRRHSNSLLFVECYFEEPLKTKTVKEEVPNEHKGIEEKPLKRHQGSSSLPQSGGQSSQKVRSHLEMIAGEIAAMVVPEWVVMNLSGGKMIEETTTEDSAAPNCEALESTPALSVGDLDSCEEAFPLTDEGAEPIGAAAEVVTKDLRTPQAATSRRTGAGWGVSKEENKADCKIS
ncbi:uncharacterized protein lrrfip1b isoform X2 [Genypterus blacodes]|uniref:uncharacterized protein lrrfip1b isoform X2 n=1 Tax=Genypterus blacodes TaxID=154954 RepID=UPI003F775668